MVSKRCSHEKLVGVCIQTERHGYICSVAKPTTMGFISYQNTLSWQGFQRASSLSLQDCGLKVSSLPVAQPATRLVLTWPMQQLVKEQFSPTCLAMTLGPSEQPSWHTNSRMHPEVSRCKFGPRGWGLPSWKVNEGCPIEADFVLCSTRVGECHIQPLLVLLPGSHANKTCQSRIHHRPPLLMISMREKVGSPAW